MKNIGICFGGYCPLHQGHMDVIMRAKKENDICYVIVCGYDNEPRGWEINLNLNERYNLISDFFKGDEQIRVKKINDTVLGLDESMSPHNWEVWTNEVKRLIIEDLNSEYAFNQDYKKTFYVAEAFYKKSIEANTYWVDEVVFIDKLNPVSGTQIRKNPIKYWNKITVPFKPYLCKNILVIGTASEGKSTLVKDISKYFDIPFAPEYGRTYMQERGINDTQLNFMDFYNFLNGQIKSCIENIEKSKNGLFIADTDCTVTLMYALAYVEDQAIKITKEDYDKLYNTSLTIKDLIKWDKIFIFPPSKNFVNDGVRYMKQASMSERNKNFEKLQKLVAEFYPDVNKTYLNGSYLENFNEVKNYINSLIEG